MKRKKDRWKGTKADNKDKAYAGSSRLIFEDMAEAVKTEGQSATRGRMINEKEEDSPSQSGDCYLRWALALLGCWGDCVDGDSLSSTNQAISKKKQHNL